MPRSAARSSRTAPRSDTRYTQRGPGRKFDESDDVRPSTRAGRTAKPHSRAPATKGKTSARRGRRAH